MSQGLSTSPMTVCTAEIAFAISHLTFRLMLHLALSVACSISLSWPILLSLSHASSCTLRSLHVRDVRHRVVEGKVNLICPKCVSLKRLSSQSLSTWPNHSIYHLSLQTWSKNMKTKPDSQLSLYEENVASNMHYQQKPKYIFESLQIYMIYILTGSKLPVNIWIAVKERSNIWWWKWVWNIMKPLSGIIWRRLEYSFSCRILWDQCQCFIENESITSKHHPPFFFRIALRLFNYHSAHCLAELIYLTSPLCKPQGFH